VTLTEAEGATVTEPPELKATLPYKVVLREKEEEVVLVGKEMPPFEQFAPGGQYANRKNRR